MAGRKGKILLWTVLLLLFIGAAALAGYVPFLRYQKERAVRAVVESIPGSLKVGKIDVDMLSNSIELHRLSGTVEFFPEMPFDLRLQKLRLEGVNWDIAQAEGPAKLVDNMLVEHLSFTPGETFSRVMGYSSVTVKTHRAEGLWLDWNKLAESGKAGTRSTALVEFLLSLRFGPTVVEEAGVKVAGYSSPGGFGEDDYIMTINRMEMERYSLYDQGKSTTWGYSQVYPSGTRFIVREMSFSSRSTPPGVLRMKLSGSSGAGGINGGKVSLALLREGYSLRDLACSDMFLVTANGEELRIPALLADVDIGNGKLLLHAEAPDVWISGSLPARFLKEYDEKLSFLANRTLHFSSLINWSAKQPEGESVSIVCHQELHEDKLGSAVLHAALTGQAVEGDILPVDIDSIAFVKGNLELQDDGFLKGYFGFSDPPNAASATNSTGTADAGEGNESYKARLARFVAVERIQSDVSNQPAYLRDTLTRLALFIEKAGSLAVQAECASPVKLTDILSQGANQEGVSMKTTHRP